MNWQKVQQRILIDFDQHFNAGCDSIFMCSENLMTATYSFQFILQTWLIFHFHQNEKKMDLFE